jgi:FKBP-type peptidyl-prolyl cis-trans isomerase FklB
MYIRSKSLLVVASFFIVANFVACNSSNKGVTELKTENEKAGYSAGYNTAEQMKLQNLSSFDIDAYYDGMKDALAGDSARIGEEERMEILMAFQQNARNEMLDTNLKAGEEFLTSNANREGIMITNSGLQYEILNSGEGKTASKNDKVKVHYHGTLIDGTIFDSSVDRGEPATFGVTQVIPGWVEALQLMKAGDKFKLYIPSELAYGERGAGGKIGPNATLIFEVELIEIL